MLWVFSGINPLGAGWIELNSCTANWLYDVDFPVNPDTGFVVGDSGTILRTTDGGMTWVKLNSGVSALLYAVHFPQDNTIGYAVGGWWGDWPSSDSGVILKTTDMGEHWTPLYSDSCFFYSVHFPLDPKTGYVAGGYRYNTAVILKTTDSGLSWIPVNPDTALDLGAIKTIYFPQNIQTGYAVDDFRSIIKTSNGGLTWDIIWDPATNICFPQDTLIGYAYYGNSGVSYSILYKTTDAGKTWESFSTGFVPDAGGDMRAILFPTGPDTGFMVGGTMSDGMLLKTTDGGKTWTATERYFFRLLMSIDFPHNNQIGYTVGRLGKIYKTTDGGAGITEDICRAPKSEFMKVSPNPFSPQTAISYSLLASAYLSLEIFDLSGRLVTTLFEGTQGAGQHAVSWNGQDQMGKKLPAGVYFCQLTTINAKEAVRISKKIIRLK